MRKTVFIISLAILALLCLPQLAMAEEPQGYRLTVHVYGENGEPAGIVERNQLADLLQIRLDLLDIDAYIHLRQGGQLIIDMFGVSNTEKGKQALFGAPSLEFLAPDGTVLLTEADVVAAKVVRDDYHDSYYSQWQLQLTFTAEGTEKFRQATAKYYGEQITLALDGVTIAKPTVKAVITDGVATISGGYSSYEDAAMQAALINASASPDDMFKIISETPFIWAQGMAEEAFTDVPADAWYAQAVEICYKYGMMKGYGDGQFKPQQTVTKAEVLAVCTRLYTVLHSDGGSASPFSDLIKQEDALNGPCTRMMMADYVGSALGESEFVVVNEAPVIPDNDTEVVKYLYQVGILSGVDDSGSFAGDKTLTRAELAVIMARVLTL